MSYFTTDSLVASCEHVTESMSMTTVRGVSTQSLVSVGGQMNGMNLSSGHHLWTGLDWIWMVFVDG